MRLLLDTHAFLWWLVGSDHLGATATAEISDRSSSVHVSAATAWEIATKHRLGKLPEASILATDVARQIALEGFHELPISVAHGQLAGGLPGPHRDPFDRMLIAQALSEGMALVSNEAAFDAYGVTRLW